MPINEATLVQRDRWPLSFDLEGVPRDSAVREGLVKAQKFSEGTMNTHPVANNFAVDYRAGETVVDINNPPRNKNYNPHAPENRFPKMLYPDTWPAGKAQIANNADEEAQLLRKGLSLKPPQRHEPSEADLDAVEQEKEVAVKTSGRGRKAQPAA